MAKAVVFDANVLIGIAAGEARAVPGLEVVRAAQRGELALAMTAAQLGEVAYVVERLRGADVAAETVAAIQDGPVEIVAVGAGLALLAARVKTEFRVGFLDAMVVALAIQRQAMVLTTDRELTVAGRRVAVRVLE